MLDGRFGNRLIREQVAPAEVKPDEHLDPGKLPLTSAWRTRRGRDPHVAAVRLRLVVVKIKDTTSNDAQMLNDAAEIYLKAPPKQL